MAVKTEQGFDWIACYEQAVPPHPKLEYSRCRILIGCTGPREPLHPARERQQTAETEDNAPHKSNTLFQSPAV